MKTFNLSRLGELVFKVGICAVIAGVTINVVSMECGWDYRPLWIVVAGLLTAFVGLSFQIGLRFFSSRRSLGGQRRNQA